MTIQFDEFRSLIEATLAPMLGAKVEPASSPSTPTQARVAYGNPCRLLLKLKQEWSDRVVLVRGQKIEPEEKQLAAAFVQVVAQIDAIGAGPFRTELLTAVPRRVVARRLGSTEFLPTILNQYEKWAAYTYEGRRITSAICIDPGAVAAQPEVRLTEVWDEDFAPVLSNGLDTLLVSTRDGRISRFEQLREGTTSRCSPDRLAGVAAFSVGGRVTATLNRHGEVLVFAEGKLRFAKRSGTWIHFLHDVVVSRMSPPRNLEVRWAIHQTCLDVSFARCGGCLGVLRKGKECSTSELISSMDLISVAESVKSRLFAATLCRPFQELDRRLRQELLALDGATILDYQGNILTVGAIISVCGGSGGGGRRAAAQKLGSLGLGIKVSKDGFITAFKGQEEAFAL